MDIKLHKDTTSICSKGCKGCHKEPLNTYDWLADIPDASNEGGFVEVQFKNTRKSYYLNSNKLELCKGDVVAVEASPGHDIGTVTLTGKLVKKQMMKSRHKYDHDAPPKVYRLARPGDIDKYNESKSREYDTMLQSRQIAKDLNLDMKIGDVEYQGDGSKATFLYIADSRVDFRQLIKVLAETLHVRIEMKQIGARQEAGRIGGIGPCGRQLCCSAWMNNFVSVNTSAARFQELSLNPQKLTGQCAKLKCCLNYEVDAYMEARKKMPSPELCLETVDTTYYFYKSDVFQREVSYSKVKNAPVGLVTIPAKRAFDIINMNRRGDKPYNLECNDTKEARKHKNDILDDSSLTRFDDVLAKPEGRKKRSGGNRQPRGREYNRSTANNAETNPDKQLAQEQGRQASDQTRNTSNERQRSGDRSRSRRNEGRRPARGVVDFEQNEGVARTPRVGDGRGGQNRRARNEGARTEKQGERANRRNQPRPEQKKEGDS